MKKICLLLVLIVVLATCGCVPANDPAPILATTRPVYSLTTALCADTGLEVGLLISENVSCLHDYSLSTTQMKALENARMVVISGAGLEDFQADILSRCNILCDASENVALLETEQCHEHEHEGHHHEHDAHIWLSPANAKVMAQNICNGLMEEFPSCSDIFSKNLEQLLTRLDELQTYGQQTLEDLSCRQIITFHDGFAYLAQAFDLTILAAVEEESGSEASARELIELIEEVRHHDLPAIFKETNGSASACGIIAAETGARVYTLDMCMGEGDYFEKMYHNINTLKEALG